MEFEKKVKNRMYLMILYIIIGAAVWAVTFFNKNVNDTLSAMGIALVAAGAAQLGRCIYLLKNPDMLRDREIAEKDERNIMLMERARSWSFAAYIILAGISVFVLFALNYDIAGRVVAFTVCGFCLIYWVCYMIAKRKY